MGIKGKTVFELTDVNTGKVEKYEDCNMITNGLQEFLDPCGSWGIYPFAKDSVRNTAVRNTLTGGIFLFDSKLDENVTNTYANASVKMVGNGALGISNATTVTELGSYNSEESGVQADGSIKYVYDFLTSQANGTIQSVCLTSKVGGYMGYGNESQKRVYDADLRNTDYQNNIYKYANFLKLKGDFYVTCMMYAVYNEDAVYAVDPNSVQWKDNSSTVLGELHWTKTGKIRINKYRLGVSSVGLTDYNYVNSLIASYDVAIPQDILNYMSAGSGSYYLNYVAPVADGNKREIFIIFSKNTNSCANGNFFWIMKIDKDMQATAYKITNNTGYNIYKTAMQVNFDKNNHYAIDNDYFWCWLQKNGSYNLVGIKYADSTQIIETDVYISSNIELTKTYDNMLEYGAVYVSNSANRNRDVFNTVRKKALTVNGYSGTNSSYKVLFADRKGLYLCHDYDNHFYLAKDPRYLATINNLSEPVVKTASKTMKVTYILTPGVDA